MISKRTAVEIPLIRFVLNPDGELVADIYEKLPVKGIWLSADRALLESAFLSGEIDKPASNILEAQVCGQSLTAARLDLVDSLLERQVTDRLGMMRRAGWLRLGFEKVVADIKAGRAAALIVASDAAAGSTDKLNGAIMSAGSQSKKSRKPIVNILSRECLSAALGQENVVYATVRENGMVQTFALEALRLAAFRGKSLPVIGPEIG